MQSVGVVMLHQPQFGTSLSQTVYIFLIITNYTVKETARKK